jgi:hypothetical protein
MKKIIIRLALGLAAAGFITAGSASAIEVDTNTVSTTIDQLIMQMQQEMISKNYSALLLKNQMRAQMMAERVPRNFMKDSMQPAMTENVRAQMKLQQMEAMTIR